MDQLPFRPFVLKDQGHPQRPVLVRHSADLAVLPFDRHKYGHVSRRISARARSASPLRNIFGVVSSASVTSKPRLLLTSSATSPSVIFPCPMSPCPPGSATVCPGQGNTRP